jgi:hypothetical protein
MKKILMLAFVLTPLLFSCKGNKLKGLADFKELKDSSLVIQAMKIKDQPDTGMIKYGVRVFPAKELLSVLTEENKQALWYKMDSSFYLESGAGKYYAAMIEPIANGQKNNFEYLVMFEIVPQMKLTDLTLVFKDKYLSHKTHSLQLSSK